MAIPQRPPIWAGLDPSWPLPVLSPGSVPLVPATSRFGLFGTMAQARALPSEPASGILGPPPAPNGAWPSQQAISVSQLEDDLDNPNVPAYLDTIATSEGGQYNSRYGGGTFSDFSAFPASGTTGTPSGRYQIEASTFPGLSRQTGLTDFSPHTQDLMAAQQIVDDKAMPSLLAGDLNKTLALTARTWASLPTGPGGAGHFKNQPPRPYGFVTGRFYDALGKAMADRQLVDKINALDQSNRLP